jgi:UDPglucose--hexose-1-phosphate uridylyltransferase
MIDHNLPHRRYNPLTGDWILVSPHRTKRPWKGALETPPLEKVPEYDPACYLCPGNARANNQRNLKYEGTFVFTNDFPALLPNVGTGDETADDLFVAHQESGTCRVVCYCPSHTKTMAKMTDNEISRVITTWKKEYEELGADPDTRYVQIFENKGTMMGASNPHPHCQIWVTHDIPTIPQKEQDHQKTYFANHKVPLLTDYLTREFEKKIRIIAKNDTFVVLVPYWATWPYETMILPKKHLMSLSDFSDTDTNDLARVLGKLTRAYDRVFNVPFPYSMGIHQAPTDAANHEEWQFHMHFYPPLLRSATVKKFLVGYEMMAEAQRDILPEDAAHTLRRIL